MRSHQSFEVCNIGINPCICFPSSARSPFHSLAFQFFIAVSNYTGAGKEDKLKFAFMIFDEEGNGVITKAELLKILKANHMASHDSEVARKADTIMVRTVQCCIGQCSIVTTRCPHE